jgi:hypothetical protein
MIECIWSSDWLLTKYQGNSFLPRYKLLLKLFLNTNDRLFWMLIASIGKLSAGNRNEKKNRKNLRHPISIL